MESTERWEIRVEGRVQGVAFRAAARQRARELQLRGWVRNEADGAVTLVAEGELAPLTALHEWCAHGPPLARVDRRHLRPLSSRGELPDPFDVVR